MPIVTVSGLPNGFEQDFLTRLCIALRVAVAGVAELGITDKQVTVFFPDNLLQAGLGEEVIARVTELFGRPERTPEVKRRVAEAVKKCLRFHLTPALQGLALVEVFVYTFDPEVGGFAGWTKEPAG
jgi:hypothetical protein